MNSKKLIVSLVALTSVLQPANARFVLGGKKPSSNPIGNSSTNSSGGVHSSRPSQDLSAASVSCEKGSTVTYDFITSLSGSAVNLEKSGNKLFVTMPEYFSACISKINLSSKLGADNNVYLKFDIDPKEEMKNSNGDTIEQKYENCVNTIVANNPTLLNDGEIDYEVANKLGLIDRNKFRKTVDLSRVDSAKDSEVIIASPQSVYEYNNSVFKQTPGAIGDSSEAKWNCMRFEQPKELSFRVYQTQKTKLLDQAIAICNSDSASIHDVEQIRAELLKSETLGNFSPLITTLGEMKYKLLKTEIDETSALLDKIEEKFEPKEDDEDIGVSKTEAKKLVNEYQAQMKKFNDELLPQIKADLQILLTKREDAQTDEEIDKIDEEIEKLSELLSVFNREDVNSERFAYLVRGLKVSADSAAAKEVFKAMFNAKYFSRVYEGEANERGPKLSLEEAQRKSEIEAKAISTKTLTAWQDERDIKAGRGDKVVKRNQKVYSEMSKRAYEDKMKFRTRFNQSDEYMSEYLKRGQKYYCQNGYDQGCMNFMQRAQTLQGQYAMSKQQDARKFESNWGEQYGQALEGQRSRISMYQSMNDQYQMELMRKKMANQTSYGSYGGGSDYDYSFFDYGSSSGSFDFMGSMSMDPMMSGQYDQYQNMGMFPQSQQPQFNQQQRGPATNFSNPYEYQQGYR